MHPNTSGLDIESSIINFFLSVCFQQSEAVAVVSGGGGGEGDGDVGGAVGVVTEAIDPYDLLDPVDVLSEMPKDFFTRVVSYSIV